MTGDATRRTEDAAHTTTLLRMMVTFHIEHTDSPYEQYLTQHPTTMFVLECVYCEHRRARMRSELIQIAVDPNAAMHMSLNPSNDCTCGMKSCFYCCAVNPDSVLVLLE